MKLEERYDVLATPFCSRNEQSSVCLGCCCMQKVVGFITCKFCTEKKIHAHLLIHFAANKSWIGTITQHESWDVGKLNVTKTKLI